MSGAGMGMLSFFLSYFIFEFQILPTVYVIFDPFLNISRIIVSVYLIWIGMIRFLVIQWFVCFVPINTNWLFPLSITIHPNQFFIFSVCVISNSYGYPFWYVVWCCSWSWFLEIQSLCPPHVVDWFFYETWWN
jgi:hypothetical protein